MKFIRLGTAYNAYLDDFYLKNPGVETQPYTTQLNHLMHDAFGWADFWTYNLGKLGYSCLEIMANNERLQRQWALERGIEYKNSAAITKQQILEFKPDVLFVTDYGAFEANWLREIRHQCPSIKLVIGWCGAPLHNWAIFSEFDIVLSCIPELVEKFRSLGLRSEHVNHGFDKRILDRIKISNEQKIPLSFCGQVVRKNEYHIEREKIVKALVSKLDMEIYCPFAPLTFTRKMKTYLGRGAYLGKKTLNSLGIQDEALSQFVGQNNIRRLSSWPEHPVDSLLGSRVKKAVFGLAMFEKLANSTVTFNSHIDISPRSASNMRMFEATGVGTCLLTDEKENISSLFARDSEVVTYRSIDECLEKARWLASHPEEARQIGLAGQRRCLTEHNYATRAEHLDRLIRVHIDRKVA